MDDEAVHTRLTHASIIPYIQQHVDEWFDAICDVVSATLAPEDILFVTGHVKASQWSLRVFECDTPFSRNVTEATLGDMTFSFSRSLKTSERESVEFSQTINRSGTEKPTDLIMFSDDTLSSPSDTDSQYFDRGPRSSCMFLDVLQAKRRLFGLPKKISAAACPKRDPRHGDGDDHAGVLSAQDQTQEASAVSGALLYSCYWPVC